MNTLTQNQTGQSPFDSIRRIKENGTEFWMARELMPLLGYQKWERFEGTIDKAKLACQNTGNSVPEHFFPAPGKTSGRPQQDFELSRYACYLVAMNGDPRKPEIASAQTYFAVKTREAETVIPQLNDDIDKLKVLLELERVRLDREKERNRGKELDNKGKEIDSAMISLHGERVVFALMGKEGAVVEKEVAVTEVLNAKTGEKKRFLSAEQTKQAVRERTGQKPKSLKEITDAVKAAGREDLLIKVERPAPETEYIPPENLGKVIDIVYGKYRQSLVGEWMPERPQLRPV